MSNWIDLAKEEQKTALTDLELETATQLTCHSCDKTVYSNDAVAEMDFFGHSVHYCPDCHRRLRLLWWIPKALGILLLIAVIIMFIFLMFALLKGALNH